MSENRLIYTVLFHAWRLEAIREGRILEGLSRTEQVALKAEAMIGSVKLNPMVDDALDVIY